MIRRGLLIFLAVLSVILAASSLVSYWHPVHSSERRHNQARWIHFQGGKASWHWEAASDRYGTPTGVPVLTELYIPGLGISSSNDGHRAVWLPGVCVDWCSQPGGYGRVVLEVRFLTLALILILCPLVHIAVVNGRRLMRRKKGHCLKCGYDLAGNVSGVCPECGTDIKEP